MLELVNQRNDRVRIKLLGYYCLTGTGVSKNRSSWSNRTLCWPQNVDRRTKESERTWARNDLAKSVHEIERLRRFYWRAARLISLYTSNLLDFGHRDQMWSRGAIWGSWLFFMAFKKKKKKQTKKRKYEKYDIQRRTTMC